MPLPDRTLGNISVKSPILCQGYLLDDDGKALRCLEGHLTGGDQDVPANDCHLGMSERSAGAREWQESP